MKERLMGLDVGTRTVGVAISDLLGMTAQPRVVIRRTSLQTDLNSVLQLANQEEVTGFVIGLPLRTNGVEGPEAAFVRAFGDKLEELTQLPVQYYDERYTTAVAQSAMIAADVKRQKRRAAVDKLAAAIILQGYLDRRHSGRLPERS